VSIGAVLHFPPPFPWRLRLFSLFKRSDPSPKATDHSHFRWVFDPFGSFPFVLLACRYSLFYACVGFSS